MMNTTYRETQNDIEQNLLNEQRNNTIFTFYGFEVTKYTFEFINKIFFYTATSLLLFIDIYIILYFNEDDENLRDYYRQQIIHIFVFAIIMYLISFALFLVRIELR